MNSRALPAGLLLFAVALPVLAGSVGGRVLDPSGKPLVGARVTWTAHRTEDEILLDETSATDATKLGETSTGPDGRFRVPIDRDPAISLRIEAAGHPQVRYVGPFDSSEDVVLADIQLAVPIRLFGRVVDDQGKGVAGAAVRTGATAQNGDGGYEESEARTGVDGAFSIPEAPPTPRSVMVRAAGFVAIQKYQVDGGEERLVVSRGGGIRGTVVDMAGHPAAGAIVRTLEQAARTGEDGRFALAGISPGLHAVEAFWKADFAGRKDAIRVAVGKESEAPIRLVRAASITGIVVDESTRKPVRGAGVSATDTEYGANRRAARTDARGRYRLNGLGSRPYSVSAVKIGYLQSTIAGVLADVSASGTANLALAPEAAVAGRVLDEKGSPVSGASIRFDGGSGLRRIFVPRKAVAAFDGTFRVRHLPSGRNYVIQAKKPDYAPARRAGVNLKAGETVTGITLVVRRGLEARGRIVDVSENPIPGAEVRLTKRENRGSGFYFSSARPDAPDATSGPDGTFRARGLEEAEYSANVTREGFASKAVQGLVVRSDGENVWAPVTLPAGVSISGIVKSSAGQPVAGANISWYASGLGGGINRDRAATTDVEGRFRVDGLTPNVAVQLTVAAESYATVSKQATPPTDEVAVVLKTAATVRGRVEEAETKRPVPEFTITRGSTAMGGGSAYFMRDWTMRDGPAQSDQGEFEVSNISPGKVTLHVVAARFRPGDVTLDVAEGEMREGVVISLRRGGSVSGRVLDGARMTPIANASVSWRAAGTPGSMGDSSSSNTTNTDADGRFRFDGMPAGTMTLLARHPDYAENSKDVDADKDGAVDVALGAGASLSGILVGRDGRSPVSGATVTLNGQGGPGGDSARTDESGAFSFEHLRPGRFRILARALEGQASPKDFVLAENQRQEGILLSLRAAGARIRGTVTGLPAGKLGSIRVVGFGKDWSDSTQTDDAGAFTFSDVPAGTMRFQVSAAAGPSRTASRTVEVPESVSEVPVEVAFDGSSRLSGRVMRGEKFVSGVWIYTTPEPPVPTSPRTSSQTDEGGKYVLEGLTDGPHQISVAGQGISYQKTLAVSGDTTADIAIPAALIAGTVTDEGSGDAIEGALVRAETGRESSSFSVKTALTDPAGRFEIAGADPGTYQVTASKSGYRMRTRGVTLGTDAAEADFALGRGAGVSVRVSDGTTGLPLREIYGIAFGPSGLVAFQGSVNLDTSGRGEIPSLTPGRYALYLFAAGLAPRSIPSLEAPSPEIAVAMTPGGRVDVRCDATVSGRLTDGANNVYLLGPGRIEGRLFCGPPAVAWENVAPGTYTLTLATGKSYALTVAEGQTSRLDLK